MITEIKAPEQATAIRILKRNCAVRYPLSSIVIDTTKTLKRYPKFSGEIPQVLYQITWHRKQQKKK